MNKFTQIYTFLLSEGSTSVIEYDRGWENGTGYLDHAAFGNLAPRLSVGEAVVSIDPAGRRIIIIGLTKKANVVVFDRYSNSGQLQVYNTGNGKIFREESGGWKASDWDRLEQYFKSVPNEVWDFYEIPSVTVETKKEIIMETNEVQSEVQHPQVSETPVFTTVTASSVEVKVLDIDSKTETSSDITGYKEAKFGDNLTYIRDRKSGIMGVFNHMFGKMQRYL